ncbi:MAG: pyridoxamine 5'-phosphate oxidase family protein [Gemmatimonadota bacterium]|nr:pyridoxamine 5'-phosphate oxidase family protein [Gemmatimonadota bacterium]
MRQVALCLLLVTCGLPLPAPLDGQALSRSQLLSAARDVMSAAPYVAFATVDEEGRPAVRAMDALAPDEGLVVWFATNPRSRKVDQLRADPRVALHYLDTDGPGYVTLNGVARLVEDPALKAGHWKESWTPFYTDRDTSVILIEVTPLWLEVVSVPHGANGDPDDWRADIVEFVPGSSGR